MSEKLQDTRSTFRLFAKRLGRVLLWNGVPGIQYNTNYKNSYLPRRIRFNLLAVAMVVVWYYSKTRLRNQAGFVDEKTAPEKRIYNFAPKSCYSYYSQVKSYQQLLPSGRQYTF